MSERIMKNFPIEYEGNTYWRSRSVAVAGFVFCKDVGNNWCVLANKRGPGCPDEVGKWCIPCGYLDFNETGEEGVVREIREECGILIKPEKMNFDIVTFSPNKDQNVTLRYWTILDGVTTDYTISNKDNEVNETTDIRWVSIDDIDMFEWAFGHEKAIPEEFEKHISHPRKFLIELHVMDTNGKDLSLDKLGVFDTREECMEYTKKNVETIKEKNLKSGITIAQEYNVTERDCVVKWECQDTPSWYYWYMFIPIPYKVITF